MSFDKKRFIAANGRFLYGKLLDFLRSETDADGLHDFLFLLTCENITDFRYEGNQYSFSKCRGSTTIVITDEVSKTHGVPAKQTTFAIDAEELAELMTCAASDTSNLYQHLSES